MRCGNKDHSLAEHGSYGDLDGYAGDGLPLVSHVGLHHLASQDGLVLDCHLPVGLEDDTDLLRPVHWAKVATVGDHCEHVTHILVTRLSRLKVEAEERKDNIHNQC